MFDRKCSFFFFFFYCIITPLPWSTVGGRGKDEGSYPERWQSVKQSMLQSQDKISLLTSDVSSTCSSYTSQWCELEPFPVETRQEKFSADVVLLERRHIRNLVLECLLVERRIKPICWHITGIFLFDSFRRKHLYESCKNLWWCNLVFTVATIWK